MCQFRTQKPRMKLPYFVPLITLYTEANMKISSNKIYSVAPQAMQILLINIMMTT